MLDLEAQKRAFNDILQIYVLPEIRLRREKGEISGKYVLTAAQVLLSGGGQKVVVRLNDEVKIMSKVKLKDGLNKKVGSVVSMNEISEIGFFQLPDEEEPNFGHISLIRLGDSWYFGFDARYNKGLARKHLSVAKQFYQSGKTMYQQKLWSPFIDNLFSAAELLAKSELLLMPDEKFAKRASHGTIKAKYNQFVNIGNADPEYAKALNNLGALRSRARYVTGDLQISDDEAVDILNVVQEMIEYIEPRLVKSLD